MQSFSPGKLLLALALIVSTMVGSAGVFAQDATPGAEPGASPAAGGEMAPPPLPPGAEVFADGLNNPRNITFGPDGALWIAEAGGVPEEGSSPCLTGPEGNEVCYNTTGSITRVLNGEQERVVEGLRSIGDRVTGMNATGPHDIAFTADGSMYLIIGLGADPATRAENEAGGPSQAGKLFLVDPESGELTEVADVAGFETSDNPDGGALDSNPYAMVTASDGSLAVVDAGANALYRVDLDGTISTLAVFPDRLELLPDESAEIPMNAVPDAVAIGADDDFYVGQLTGFPFPLGGANVYRVDTGGSDPVLHSDGFTNIIDVAFGPNGDMYVLQIVSGGMANINPANPSTMAGDLIRVTPDNQREVIVSGLVMPTGLALGDDGSIYVVNLGPMAGAGQVLRFGPEGSPAPAGTPETGAEATPAA
jgi:glucose/arabinose dehydrogenase